MLLPAPIERIVVERSDIDRAMPEWQFRERHRIRINASPDAVYRAIQTVTAGGDSVVPNAHLAPLAAPGSGP